jgi:hypothetical protein
MAMVMITCPITNRQVFTGIETDPASIAMLPPVNTRLTCPACGTTHVWSMLDADLIGAPAEQPAALDREMEYRLGRLRERTRAHGAQRPLRRLPRAS